MPKSEPELRAEGLAHFGLTEKDVSRHAPSVCVVTDGLLTIRTAQGPLTYRAGDGDLLTCPEAHTYPRFFGGCKRCWEREKHSLNPAKASAAVEALGRLNLSRRKIRIDSTRTGAAPGPRGSTWGGTSWQ